MAYASFEQYLGDVKLKLAGYLWGRQFSGEKPTRQVCVAAVRTFVNLDGYSIDAERLDRLCTEALSVPEDTAATWAVEDGYWEVMDELFRQAEAEQDPPSPDLRHDGIT